MAGRKSLGNTYGSGIAFSSLRQSKHQPLYTEHLDSYDAASYNRLKGKNLKIDHTRLSNQLHSNSTAPPLPEDSPEKAFESPHPLESA